MDHTLLVGWQRYVGQLDRASTPLSTFCEHPPSQQASGRYKADNMSNEST